MTDGILILGSGGAVPGAPPEPFKLWPGGTVMHLTPRELGKLMIYMFAELATRASAKSSERDRGLCAACPAGPR